MAKQNNEAKELPKGKGKSLKDVALEIAKSDNNKVSSTKKYNVEFTEDFNYSKKGDVLNGISEMAFKFYKANGVVKEVE